MGKINFLQTDVLQLLEPWNSGEASPPLILDSIDNIETGESMTLYRYREKRFFFSGGIRCLKMKIKVCTEWDIGDEQCPD